MCKKFLFGAILTAAVCLTACKKDTELIDDFTTTTVSQKYADGTAEQTVTAIEKSEGLPKIVINPDGVNEYENINTTDDYIPQISDPYAAAEKYIEELSESENVTTVELLKTRIGDNTSIVKKYYDDPRAEEWGLTEEDITRGLIPVNVEYRIEYTENSGLESGEKSEYFIVFVNGVNKNGFYVIDTFPYAPNDYYGEVNEITEYEDNGFARFYTVELEGGLGTVKCNSAEVYMNHNFEAGTRIYIEGNGGIYGDPPRLDAIYMREESELSDGE